MEKKEILLLSLFLTIIFLGQLFIADRVIFGDDYIFATLAEKNQYFFTENAHPPLPVWLDIFLTEVFPLNNRTIRLTSIIFATLTVGLVYFIGKRISSEKTGAVAALFVGLSAWHIRASQMNSGSDGGMFTFFFYLTIYCLIRYFDEKKRHWVVGTGISFGLTMLTKETAFLLLPILVIVYWINTEKERKEERRQWLKETTVKGILLLAIAILVFSIFPILDTVYNDGQSIHAIQNRVVYVTEQQDVFFLELFSIFKITIWAGPLFILGFLLWIKEKKGWKNIAFITVGIVSLFYLFFTPATLDRTRYLMVTIPAFSIICGEYITTIWKKGEMGKKEAWSIGILSICLFGIFLWINQNSNIIPYESEENPLILLKQGNLDFSVPIFTETDNSGFLLHFSIFAATYIIATLAFLLLLTKNKTVGKCGLIIFLSVSIGYNFIVAEEYGFHWTSQNYSDGIKELIMYAETTTVKEPLYLLKNYEFQYYLRDKYQQFVSTYGISETDETKIAQFAAELDVHGGTVIFTDMPPMDKNGLLWKTINDKCVAVYTVVDKGIEIGWVFSC